MIKCNFIQYFHIRVVAKCIYSLTSDNRTKNVIKHCDDQNYCITAKKQEMFVLT